MLSARDEKSPCATARASKISRVLDLFDLVELEFDGCLATEDRDKRADFFFFRLDLIHYTGEVEERSRGDLDAVALGEVDLELGRLDAHLLEDRFHFFVLQRDRFLARTRGADEARHARRVAYDV